MPCPLSPMTTKPSWAAEEIDAREIAIVADGEPKQPRGFGGDVFTRTSRDHSSVRRR